MQVVCLIYICVYTDTKKRKNKEYKSCASNIIAVNKIELYFKSFIQKTKLEHTPLNSNIIGRNSNIRASTSNFKMYYKTAVQLKMLCSSMQTRTLKLEARRTNIETRASKCESRTSKVEART